MFNAFIQARMSSVRYPGKVLAPFRGRPLIDHVIAAVRTGLPTARVVVLTSQHPTDTPLAAYLATQSIAVFRGALDHVFNRFHDALQTYPCEAFFRICADSPLMDPQIFTTVAHVYQTGTWDLVTTTFPRTHPQGRNAELLRTQRFLEIAPEELTAEEQEHLTAYYYHHPALFRIHNVEAGHSELEDTSFTVDTLDDLKRLE